MMVKAARVLRSTLLIAFSILFCISTFTVSAQARSTIGITTEEDSTDATYHIVTFNSNYSGGSVHHVSVPSGGSVGDSIPRVSRSGFDFNEWNTDRDGMGTEFRHDIPVTDDIEVFAQWIRKEYEVRFVDYYGLRKLQMVLHGENATAPTVRIPSGYSFTEWDRSFTNVTSNITVTALYDRKTGGGGSDPDPNPDPDPDPDPTPTPPTTPSPGGGGGGGDGGGGGGGGGGTNPEPDSGPSGGTIDPEPVVSPEPVQPTETQQQPPVLPQEENVLITEAQISETPPEERWVDDGSVPRVSIGGKEVLLFAPFGSESWALLNLILCILGVVFALMITIRIILKKKRERGKTSSAHSDEYENEQDKKTRIVWLATAIVMAIAGVFVFLLTQDMMKMMVITDLWTIVNAVILVVEIVAILFVNKKRKKDDNDTDSRLKYIQPTGATK